MWWLAAGEPADHTVQIYYVTAIAAAVIAAMIGVTTMVSRIIKRSREEAVEKERNLKALTDNTAATTKLEETTLRLAEKLDDFALDVRMTLRDHAAQIADNTRRIEEVARRKHGED